MEVIAPQGESRSIQLFFRAALSLVLGAILLTIGIVVAYVAFGTPFLVSVSTGGPLTPGRVVVGVLAWTIALTAPVGFGMLGVLRLADFVERIFRRRQKSPTVRAARSLGEDITVAADVFLPDGRPVPELVIGPFGAAVIAPAPVSRNVRRINTVWEQRMSDGRWLPIEHPLDRAVRDAERVRRWFGADDTDFVVKVHAAVVDPTLSLERTPSCAVIAPNQISAWLRSLPPQRGMSPDRRARLVEKVRATF